jgi:hypothetical protein
MENKEISRNGTASLSSESARARSGAIGRVRATLTAAFALATLGAGAALLGSAAASPIEFTDVEKQARQFMEYYKSIELTPEQEEIKKEALSRIPAPCCGDNTAYTCCCPCNMAKSWWGLSHHLIANEGANADEVQAAVEAWIEFIGPDGFSGNACYTGGCKRAFKHNGCGGMSEKDLKL